MNNRNSPTEIIQAYEATIDEKTDLHLSTKNQRWQDKRKSREEEGNGGCNISNEL